jgi:hypothetical protein
MDLTLIRYDVSPQRTIGLLLVDHNFECYTLEDTVRTGPKIPGNTAIPEGVYKVVISLSNRFKRLMPEVLAVPGFTGIRIHSGNTDADTEGCPLLGAQRGSNSVALSRLAFAKFFEKLTAARDRQEPCQLTVTSARSSLQSFPV